MSQHAHGHPGSTLGDQRVLVLHNRYRQSGGEERYVQQLAALLTEHAGGCELIESASSELGALRAARGMTRGGLDAQVNAVRDAVRDHGITMVHAHNLHPAFGWRALAAARDAGARTVLHLHNYRLFCAIGIAFRDGADCTECAPDRTRRGLVHNCRGSLPQAAAYARGLGRWQQSLIDAVDRFAAPVQQLSDDMRELGFDLPIDVLPTWLEESQFVARSLCADGEYGLFVGRVSEEKGIFVAIEAAKRSGVPLRVAGGGEDLQRAMQVAKDAGAPVEFLGQLDGQGLVAARMGAAFCVLPSVWREVLPFAALEALAAGLPLVVSERGGLPELTDPELVVAPGDPDELAEAMARLMSDATARAAAGERALERAHARYSEAAFVPRLAALYERAAAAPVA